MMKRYHTPAAFILLMTAALLFPTAAHANSSWHWLSSKRPYELLLYIIPITLIAETAAVNYLPGVRRLSKVFCVVTAANAASFAAPFVLPFVLTLADGSYPIGYTLSDIIDRTPFYTVGLFFVVVTLAVEVPVVYLALRKDCEHKRRLLITVIGVNLLTTALSAAAERLLCYGQW